MIHQVGEIEIPWRTIAASILVVGHWHVVAQVNAVDEGRSPMLRRRLDARQ
jgi:hypothetical protein